MKKIVIVGGGFAGVWSAIGAARKIEELSLIKEDIQITLISRDGYLGIRPRYYESELDGVRVGLDKILPPIGVNRIEGNVLNINVNTKELTLQSNNRIESLVYDRLVLAAGSKLFIPPIKGLLQHAYSVDTYTDAIKLDRHLNDLSHSSNSLGLLTAVVIGAGFTGIEVAAEMTKRLSDVATKIGSTEKEVRVVLVDRVPVIGQELGSEIQPIIQQAMADLKIETRAGATISAFNPNGVTLDNGEEIVAQTVIWSAGLRANPLTELFPVERDELGRLEVDTFLRIKGVKDIFAAGDVAKAKTDEVHNSLMICQHARPQGMFAGHNVVSDLVGEELKPYRQETYVTCLDLGPWGAVFTRGWDRKVELVGEDAKKMKISINTSRIYPPLSEKKQEILDSAKLPV